ncbi:MAG: T9SS type A sorting domain-containing protein [Bacteroidota bacterium]
MKKIKQLVSIVCVLCCYNTINAQSYKLPTPNPHNNKDMVVYDREGNAHDLKDLKFSVGNDRTISPTCIAGIFRLHFQDAGTGWGFDDPVDGQQKQTVACQVFTDLSGLLNEAGSPYTSIPNLGNGRYVEIEVKTSSNDPSGGTLATAGQFYLTTSLGITHGSVWQTINTGIDAWFGIDGSNLGNVGIYHGWMQVNFGKNFWLGVDNPALMGPTQYDLYTTVLHEAFHALGFGSLIDSNGNSKLPPYTNTGIYSIYDTYLRDHATSNFLINWNGCYTASSTVSPLSKLTTPCSIRFSGTNSTFVSTDAVWSGGTSLSHYPNGACSNPGTYVMNPAIALQTTKRSPHLSEVTTLCDIGYSTSGTYAAVNYGAPGTCGSRIAGVNDYATYIASGPGTVFMTPYNTAFNFSSTDILGNDENATYYSCLEVVNSSGSLGASPLQGGTGNTITFTPNTNYSGVAILKYIPRVNSTGARGNITYIFIVVESDFNCNYSACNLVPNGNFEQYSAVPTQFSEIHFTCGWRSAQGTADYYHRLSTTSMDVPNNIYGNENDNSGDAYAGVAGGSNSEAIYTKLPGPLLPNKNYRLTLDASVADNFAGNPYPLQVYFSNYFTPPVTVTNFAMLFQPATISSSTGWTTVTLNFTTGSIAGEQYVVIGDINAAPPNNTYIYINNVALQELPDVPLTAVAAPPKVCLGNSSTLIASGALSYSWAPTTGLSCTTCANPTVSPTVNTTYTVTGTMANGCTATATASIQIGMPIVTVTPSAPTIPTGGSVGLLASGALTYTWAPSTGLNTTTGANVIASPATTTTYTVTGSTGTGCTGTAIVVVKVGSCNLTYDYVVTAAGANSSTLFAGLTTITNKNISVLGTLTINNNMTFSGCNIVMDPNVKIDLTTGNLTLNNQTHVYSCGDMWDGIYVPNGRTLTTSSSTFIEDAMKAVNIAQGATATIDQTIFNRNMTAIELTSNTSASSPLTLTNSAITCRNIPFTSTTATNQTIAQVKTNITSGTPWTTTLLKAPWSGQKGFRGVNATDVNTLNLGSTALAVNLNIFDAIMCGINLERTNAVVYNNRFQYLLGHNNVNCPSPPSPCYYDSGMGIRTSGTVNTGTNTLTVGDAVTNGPNSFYNTYIAIYSVYYQQLYIMNNSIDNTSTGPFTGGTLNYGKSGVQIISPTQNNVIWVNNQTLIRNCENGIFVNRNYVNSLITNGFFIQNNIITATNGYCTNGINVTDLLSSSSSTIYGWSIAGNTISEAANCINLLNVKNTSATDAYYVSDNLCTVRYNSGSTNTNGIKTKGCTHLDIIQNHTKYNNIGGLAYNSGGNINSYGIYLENSSNMLVKCNLIEDAARSLVLKGTCTSSLITNSNPLAGITQNTMRRAQDGFVLLTSGVIGQQGSGTVASNNYWDLTTTPTFTNQTNADNSNANNSMLYVNNITTGAQATRPLSNFQILGTAYAWTTNLFSSTGSPSSGGAVPIAPGGGGFERSGELTVYGDYLKTIVEDSTELPVYSDEAHWQRKKFVFDEIRSNSLLTDNGSLNGFYNKNTTGAYGIFSQIDEEIIAKRYKQANNINNNFNPTNLIESNQKTVNSLILKKLIDPDYIYKKNDISVLENIAGQCPIKAGHSVYQSRNMLMTILNEAIEFTDNCDENYDRADETILDVLDNIKNRTFKLYPNPNNGVMILDYSLSKNEQGSIMIYDVTGKLIVQYELNNANEQISISDEQLINGIYFYHIKVNDKILSSNKLVIIK